MADVNIQQLPVGFGSYLDGILPPDIAVAAGAFSVAVSQIKNITNVPVEKFAQICMNMETIAGLNVNGTTVPTNLDLRNAARPLIALGSGPQQSYTMSDFFGCMSGLPYNKPLMNIYNKLNEVATTKLFHIYHEMYLAVTYERARLKSITQPVYNVMVQPYIAADPSAIPPVAGQPRIDDWYYTITFAYDSANKGGGYGRGTAVPPEITISPNNVGASATTTIGTDDTDIPGNFGRVKSVTANFGSPYKYATTSVSQASAPAAPEPPHETISIALPPIDYLPVQASGAFSTSGVNVLPGWSKDAYSGTVSQGPAEWPGINDYIQQYVDQANAEIDAILLAKPNQCKNLNNSWNDTGYQLNIEQRARVAALRPPLDDVTREDYLSLFPTTQYTFVDSIPQYAKNIMPHMYAQTLEAICNLNTPGGQSIVAMMRESRNQDRLIQMGIPLDNNIKDTLTTLQQSILAGTNIGVGIESAPITIDGITISTNSNPSVDSIPIASYDPITNDLTIVNNDYSTNNTADVGQTGQIGVVQTGGQNSQNSIGQTPANVVDFGTSNEPGSFSGSQYANILQPNLNIYYISNTLLPSTYTVSDAIDEVIRCNCDCWDLI